MDIYSILSETYTQFTIIAISENYSNQMDVSLNGKYLGSFTLIGYQGPINPPDDYYEFNKDLFIGSVSTSVGVRYIFNFSPADIKQTSNKFLPGVYTFTLSNNGVAPFTELGNIQDESLLCCMAQALNAGDVKCGKLANIEQVNTVHALLTSANAALRLGSSDKAQCLYDAAINECSDCNC